MKTCLAIFVWVPLNLILVSGAGAAPSQKLSAQAKPTGKEALAAVRHDWKKQLHQTVHAKFSTVGPVPAHFGRLSPEVRLAYLHARRDVNPARFDHFHPTLGPLLARDDRLRAGQSQDCGTMNGLLPSTPLSRYLHHRRNLNPTRFDRFHPSLGAILAEDDNLRSNKGCVATQLLPPPVTVPPPPGTPAPGPPIGGGPPPVRAVPEPGSLTLVSLGLAGVLMFRVARRWKSRPVSAPI